MARKFSLTSTLSTLLIAFLVAIPASADSPFDGHWEGSIAVPGQQLEIDVDLESDTDGTLSGDISIEVQGLRDLDLVELSADGVEIRFEIPNIPGAPSFVGTLAESGTEIAGTFSQGGSELAFELSRIDTAAATEAALEGLGEVINQAIEDFNVPGLGIAVVAGGEVVYAEGFGHRDLENDLPMTADSLFAIGSTTKAMTATTLAMMADEGLFDWDEPLTRYLPSFRLADPMITARITPRDLVTHRSGLPRHDMLWYNNNESTREEIVAAMAHLELSADLREKFQYNNLMFMTAGYLAGQLSGTTWEETVRTRLFEPLGMERSNFSVAESQTDEDFAQPYRENDEDELELIPFRSIDLIGPAGSVNSSVREMSRWLAFNLSQGMAGDAQLISAASLADVHAPHMTLTPPSPESRVSQQAYGLGWVVGVYRGHRRIQHGGGIDGFITSVTFFPDDDFGIVAFTNIGSGLASLVSQTAADSILGLEPVDWIGEALERRKKGKEASDEAEEKMEDVRVADTKPSHSISDYPGTYEHPGYGVLEITDREGDNALQFTLNGITAPFEHWHYDVWVGAETDGDPTFENEKILFRSDFEGQITTVEAVLDVNVAPIAFAKRPAARLSDPEYIQRFAGTYESRTGQQEKVELSAGVLTLHIPGQQVYTLEPAVSGRFNIQGLQGFSIGFEEDGDEVSAIVYYQPNGVFESKRIDE